MSVVVIREVNKFSDMAKIIDHSPVAREHKNALALLTGYITMSDKAYAGDVDGATVCVWGIMRQSLLSDRGYIWLLVTELAEDHKFLIIRYSQRVISELLKRYRVLSGECAIGDWRARKWMRLLGATFSQPEGKTIPFQIVGKHG